MVKRIDMSEETVDYSLVHTAVTLVDLTVNTRHVWQHQVEDILKVAAALRHLNVQIKEVTGYNLMITKLKETLVTITTKWQLLRGNSALEPSAQQVTLADAFGRAAATMEKSLALS